MDAVNVASRSYYEDNSRKHEHEDEEREDSRGAVAGGRALPKKSWPVVYCDGSPTEACSVFPVDQPAPFCHAERSDDSIRFGAPMVWILRSRAE